MVTPTGSAVDVGSTADAKRAAAPGNRPLRGACEGFEALLVSHLVKEMWRAAEAVGSEGASSANKAYRDMFTFEIARSVMSGAGLGVADVLYREMSGATDAASPPPKTGEETG